MNKYFYRWTCICLLFNVIATVNVCAQKGTEVVYRDYNNVELGLLNLLRREMNDASFKGMTTLKRETRGVKENTSVEIMKPSRMGKRKMKPEEMIEKRKESVLMICKYLKAPNYPERVIVWATATVLSEDGVCVTNHHVLRELIDPSVKLNVVDSVLFVATESGEIYPIASVLSYNQSADLAFFKVNPGEDRLRPIPLGKDLHAGAKVHVLTHPDGYLYSYSSGVVARTMTKNGADPFANRVEITADYAKGSSGGPIMDDCGNMIAMVSSIRSIYFINEPPMHQQMNVRPTVPVSSLLKIIQKDK